MASADAKLAATLGEVHLSGAEAEGLARDALHLLDEIADRDAKDAAARAAVAAVDATDQEIREHLASISLILRAAGSEAARHVRVNRAVGMDALETGGTRQRGDASTGGGQATEIFDGATQGKDVGAGDGGA